MRIVASRTGERGSVTVHQDIRLYAGLFGPDEAAHHVIEDNRLAYVHVIRGSVHVNGHPLSSGDAAKLTDETRITLDNGVNAEVLVFDMAPLP